MKTCPNCGSILADNEPYCENCGFDPSYDSGSWNYGRTSSKKPYLHGEHIKANNYVLGEEIDSIIFIIALAFLIFTIGIPFYNNDNIGIMIIFLIAFVIVSSVCILSEPSSNRSNKFKYDKKTSEKIKKTYSEKISCPNCGKKINKKAVRCKYCNYYFKDGSVKAKSNTKKSRSNVLYSDRCVDLTKQKELEGKPKHVRCKICNHVIDVDFGVCEYCGYEIGPMRKFKK